MKVKEIMRLLAAQDPEAEIVLVTLDGEFGVTTIEPQPVNRVFIYSDEVDYP